ncbi:MAG: NAD(P)-dependent oxidoreductase [Betaproteobacteria bacterium]|jgi:3-hydroxyisobutyrate dehydrogenase and related beta-hydroxyacid dehydrogenases|nr:NAD(P)-dependent oxidoreductase [Betaproteobacteria bacterium]
MKRMALLGTGLMGKPVGLRLLEAGFDLTVWNRSPEKTRELELAGARVVKDCREAVRGAEGVLTLLANGPVVTEILNEVLDQLLPTALWLGMSSIPPATAREHAQCLAVRGIQALDAPVSGGVVGAAQGTLAIMVGGEVTAFESARGVFDVLGRATHVGPAGAGSLAKLANQMIVGGTIGIVAEALLLAQAGGADPAAVRQALRGGFAESRILDLHGARMLTGDFAPGAHCRTQLKDLDSALDVAREQGLSLPLTEQTGKLYADFVAQGGGELDHSALWLALARYPGDCA